MNRPRNKITFLHLFDKFIFAVQGLKILNTLNICKQQLKMKCMSANIVMSLRNDHSINNNNNTNNDEDDDDDDDDNDDDFMESSIMSIMDTL